MPTDMEWLKALVQLMNQNDLAELSLEEEGPPGKRKVRLRKLGAAELRVGAAHPVPMAAAPVPAASKPAAAGAAGAAGGGAERPADVVEVLSPMVGTFYRASSPEADPYVEAGDAVKEDTTLCIIEAMKVMNEIKAEMEGTVQEVLVSNGEAVEYGQPLFLLKRAK
ncbi:MAG TPA: acetyl-CoA carboxylase biotin carboxyl carrier protein [Planctomycetota bacterium]|nr:acetyl-CoA carboxylase biotin carboxyl carrier protein [Planctomycetota bacterium]